MKCPECHENIQINRKFCHECGTKLTKECPVCGKQEPIGSILCQTKLDEIRKKRDEYIDLKMNEARKAIGGKTIEIVETTLTKHILEFFVSFLLLTILSLFLNFLGTFLIIIAIPIIYVVWLANEVAKAMEIAKEKAEKEFLEKIPNTEYRDSLVNQKISKIKQELLEKQERYQ